MDALHGPADWLQVAPWGAPQDDTAQGSMAISRLRQAIREEEKLHLLYERADGCRGRRIIRPVALIYHINCVMLAAWCEWRGGLRHFRTDRTWDCAPMGQHFTGQAAALLAPWQDQQAAAAPDSPPADETADNPGAAGRSGAAAP